MLHGYLAGLPAFLAYFVTAAVLIALFATAYIRITPHDELLLIRDGNLAAVPAFLGAIIGFVLPLTTAMQHSVSWVDFVIWAVIAALVQVTAFFTARVFMPGVSRRIVAGEISGGVWLGGIALVFGMVNAASMTP